MGISRRGLLQLAPVLAAAGVIPKRLLADSPSASFAELSQASFGGCVNTAFEAVDAGAKSIWVTLTSVEDQTAQVAESNRSAWSALPRRASGEPPRLDAFALHYYGPPGSLAQGTYTMNHATLGSFAMFLVPQGYSSYIAIVNRLIGPLPEAPRRVRSKASMPK